MFSPLLNAHAHKDVRAMLRKLILENYLFTDDEKELDDADSFLDSNIVDSMGILEVILFITEQFGIEVTEQEMIPENLDSINNLLAFIGRKKVNG